jgi:hypothetical protein
MPRRGRLTPPESAISEAHHLPQHNPDVIWTGVNPSEPSSSTPEWLIWAQYAALEPESSQAHSRRSDRSCSGTPVAQRDDRWSRPSREIRRYGRLRLVEGRPSDKARRIDLDLVAELVAEGD